MRYTVRRKQMDMSDSGTVFSLMLKTPHDVQFFEIGEDDYARVNVGDTIEMLITVIQPEPLTA